MCDGFVAGVKWLTQYFVAIWDNRSAFHTATFDYEGLGERFGHRAVGIGEAPYLDPNSKSRSEVLSSRSSVQDSGKGKGVDRAETVSA
jgi:hypothetical protein